VPAPGYAQSTAELALRIDRLETQLRDLTGMIDDLTHQLQQLQQLVEVLRADNETLYQMLAAAGVDVTAPTNVATTTTTQTETTTAPPPITPAATPASGAAPVAGPATPVLQQQAGAPLDLTQALRPDGNFNIGDGAAPAPATTETPAAAPTPGAAVPSAAAPAASAPAPAASGAAPTTTALVPTGNAQADYDVAYQYVLNGDYEQAEQAFRTFLANYPGNPLDVDAQFWVAESLFSRGLFRDAANAFYNAYVANPDHEKAPDMLLKLGISLAQLGQTQSACDTFQLVLARYPDASNALRQRIATEQSNAHC
jgi:tol-pal system protein YbgF